MTKQHHKHQLELFFKKLILGHNNPGSLTQDLVESPDEYKKDGYDVKVPTKHSFQLTIVKENVTHSIKQTHNINRKSEL